MNTTAMHTTQVEAILAPINQQPYNFIQQKMFYSKLPIIWVILGLKVNS